MKMYYVEKKKPQVEKYHCQRNVEHNEQDKFLQIGISNSPNKNQN